MTDYITAVSSASGTTATLRQGQAPSANGGPTVTPTGNSTVISGGTSQTVLRSSSPISTVYVAVGGASSYYELRLPVPEQTVTLVLEFAQSLASSSFDCVYGAGTTSGAIGQYVAIPTQSRLVGTGDVQVSLSWNTGSDVDLHVVDPSGEEIFFANRTSASGGVLDLDSNAGCSSDNVRNENITWPAGRAPSGNYTVRVDYWSSCGASQTDYVVRVNNGPSSQVYTGVFTGSGDNGFLGAGRTITTFRR